MRRLPLVAAVLAGALVAWVSAPPSPASAATCVLSTYPPASATVILNPSRPVTGEAYTVSGSGFPSGVTSVRIDVTGPAPGSTANAPINSGVLLGVQLVAPAAEGRYTMRLTTPGSTAVNCEFTFRVVTRAQAAVTTTTTTIDPTVTTPTVPGETTTSTTSTTLPPQEDRVISQPGEVITIGDFTYALSRDRPGILELSIQGLAPGSTSSLGARTIAKVYRADFETDPFDPLAPFDLSKFVTAGLFDLVPQDPTLGTAPVPTQIDPNDERVIGPSVTGAMMVDLAELNMTTEEFLSMLSAGAVPFPEYFADDPALANATRWIVFDVTVAGATPGSNLNVFWYSAPVELARAEVSIDGTASFQAAVPETMITTGESDTLRLTGIYPAGTAIADANGFIAQDVVLSDEILYFGEKGSYVSILFSGIAADGTPKEGSVDILIDALRPPDGADRGWLVWSLAALLLLLLLLLLLWLLRRRDEDDDEPLSDGDVPVGASTVSSPGLQSESNSGVPPPPPGAGIAGSGASTPPPPPPPR